MAFFFFNTVNSAFSQYSTVPDELMPNSLASDHVSVYRYRMMTCKSPSILRVANYLWSQLDFDVLLQEIALALTSLWTNCEMWYGRLARVCNWCMKNLRL